MWTHFNRCEWPPVLGLNCLKGFDESGNPSLGIVGETLQEPALYRAVTRLSDGCIVIANVLGEGALHKYDAAGRFLRNLDAADWGNTTGLANDPTDENFFGRAGGFLREANGRDGAVVAEVDLVQYGPVNVCANNENVIVPFRSQGAGLLIFDNATFGHEDPRIIGGPFQANTVDCDLGNGVVFVTETSDSAPLGRGIYMYDLGTDAFVGNSNVGEIKNPSWITVRINGQPAEGATVSGPALGGDWTGFSQSTLGDQAPSFDSVAVTNIGSASAALHFLQTTLVESAGSPAQTSPRGANQAALELQPGEQVARLRTDLFSGDTSSPAWIELTGDTSGTGTFFQFGTNSLSQLDGGAAFTETSTDFRLTRVFDGPGTFRGQDAVTGITIFNPNEEAVTVSLTYLAGNGGASRQGAPQVVREIPARSMMAAQASDLFDTAGLSGGVIAGQVTQGEGVVAFEVIQLQNQSTILGLNAATGNPGNLAYSAQLASQPGLYTSVNVHNSAAGPRNVTLSAIGEDGGSLADPVQQLLQPGQTFTADAAELFGGSLAGPSPSGEVNLIGSLVVEADGDGIVGDVIFGDATSFQYAASLPMQIQTFEEALFNQVANIAGFFTGLAFFYPGDSQANPKGVVPDAEITIQVFLPDGSMVGQSVQTLAVGQRISRLVAQLVEEAVNLGGGYVRIFSTQPIIGQMLFGVVGPQGIQLFSAVPPTVIR